MAFGSTTVDGYLADEDRPSTVVEPKPRATGLTLDEIVADHLNYLHHEAFFVVSTTFEVTVYRTLWFGLQYDSETVEQEETVGNGALATVRWYDGEPEQVGHTPSFVRRDDPGRDRLVVHIHRLRDGVEVESGVTLFAVGLTR